MTGDLATTSCDVIAGDRPAVDTLLVAKNRPRNRFFVSAEHLERLKSGELPVIATERFDQAELFGRPALLVE